MKLPIDIATRVSAELSARIEKMIDAADGEPPQTLDEVRSALLAHSASSTRQTEFLHPQQDRESLLVELDDLIEEYGGEALATEFVVARPTEGLSRVIEAAINEPTLPGTPTLGAVRAAMVEGLTARVAGEGTIDEGDEGVLLGEIDALIRRYGADAPAEDLIRFE